MSSSSSAARGGAGGAGLPPLDTMPIKDFITYLNGQHALGLSQAEIDRSASVLQDQWFNVAEELRGVDMEAFGFLPLPKQLPTCIFAFFTPHYNPDQLFPPASQMHAASSSPLPPPQSHSADLEHSPMAASGLPTSHSAHQLHALAPGPSPSSSSSSSSSSAPRSSLEESKEETQPQLPSVSPAGHEGLLNAASSAAYSLDLVALEGGMNADGQDSREHSLSGEGGHDGSSSEADSGSDDSGSGDEVNGDVPRKKKKNAKWDRHSSLLALKKAVDHVCASATKEEHVLASLANILRAAMNKSGKHTQNTLRGLMKKLQDKQQEQGPSSAANALPTEELSMRMKSLSVGGLETGADAPPPALPLATSFSSSSSSSSSSSPAFHCGMCHGVKDKPFVLECGHRFCASCIGSYVNELVGQKQAVGIKCPFSLSPADHHAGCPVELSTATIQRLLSPSDFESYLNATLMSFIESDDCLTVTCPNDKCASIMSVEPLVNPQVPTPITEQDDDGRVLTKETYLHFIEYRVRCRDCNTNFCAKCRAQPYHKGHTCAGFKEYQASRHCRFCSSKLPPEQAMRLSNGVRDVCAEKECQEKSLLCCEKVLECGCACNGIKNEAECLPCLKHVLKIDEDEYCGICYVEGLKDAPCLQLAAPCGHVFHYACLLKKLESKWPGARIGFDFLGCPLCKHPIQHPSLKRVLDPINALEASIKEKSLKRLQYECRDKDPAIVNANGAFYNDPVGFAMKSYLFYTCYTCKLPYFAGGNQCQEAGGAYDPAELICPACQPTSVDDCATHGRDWLAFKCRYCCSYATWTCWSNCLRLGTLVVTDDQRLITAESVKPGVDRLLGNGGSSVEVADVQVFPARQTFRIATDSGSYEVTGNHQLTFVVTRNPLVTVTELADRNHQHGATHSLHLSWWELGGGRLRHRTHRRLCVLQPDDPSTASAVGAAASSLATAALGQEQESLSAQAGRPPKPAITCDLCNTASGIVPQHASTDSGCCTSGAYTAAFDAWLDWSPAPSARDESDEDIAVATGRQSSSDDFNQEMDSLAQLELAEAEFDAADADGCEYRDLCPSEHARREATKELARARVAAIWEHTGTKAFQFELFTGTRDQLQVTGEELLRDIRLMLASTPFAPQMVRRGQLIDLTCDRLVESWHQLSMEAQPLLHPVVVPTKLTESAVLAVDAGVPLAHSGVASVASAAAGAGAIHRECNLFTTGPSAFISPMEAAARGHSAKIAYQLHNPFEAETPAVHLNNTGRMAATFLDLHAAHLQLGLHVTEQTGLISTELNPATPTGVIPSSPAREYARACDGNLAAVLRLGVSSCVAFGAVTRFRWLQLSHAKHLSHEAGLRVESVLPLSLKADKLVVEYARVQYCLDGSLRKLLVYFSPHPSLTHRMAEIACAVGLAHGMPVHQVLAQLSAARSPKLLSVPKPAGVSDVVNIEIRAEREADRRYVIVPDPALPGAGTLTHNCHFCDACHKSGVWQTLAIFRTGKNKRKLWEYPQCTSLQKPVEAIGREALSEDEKNAKIAKLLSAPHSCPLGVRHPPNGIEFGLGCSMCGDRQSVDDAAAYVESIRAKLGTVRAELTKAPRVFTPTLEELQSNEEIGRGLFYYLGTSGNTQPWSNPAEAGFVKIGCSGAMNDSAPLSALVGRELVRLVSQPQRNSWFTWELIDLQLCMTHYTLKHYNSWDTEALRVWTIEGSNDGGAHWEAISVHANDASLNKKGATHTWQVDSRGRKYSMFRILQTGRNSNNNFYLALSGSEFYGEVSLAPVGPPPAAAPSGKMVFTPRSDFDNNGLIYWLGTQMGTAPWRNPCDLKLVIVACSELSPGPPPSEPPSAVVGRDVVRCVSVPKPNQWFVIDLTPSGKRIKPSHYSLRHYSSWDLEALRNWRFEGSANGVDWFILSVHLNDSSLDRKGATHTWALPGCQVVCSMFRIWQTGLNSNNHHYLACSGFEVYGTLEDAGPSPRPLMHLPQQAAPPVPLRPNFPAVHQPLVQPQPPLWDPHMQQHQQQPQVDQHGYLLSQQRPPAYPVGVQSWVPPTPLLPLGPPSSADSGLVVLKFAHDNDQNGLMYYLGTQGKRALWRNPADAGLVSVRCSELAVSPPSVSANAICGQESVRCCTVGKPDMYFLIDLKDKAMALTHYTLRHYSSWDTEALRNWKLEGSNDAVRWDVLRQHRDDRALNGRGQTATWPIAGAFDRFYRFFKLTMTGPNSNANHYMACSGFEVYGLLQLWPNAHTPDAKAHQMAAQAAGWRGDTVDSIRQFQQALKAGVHPQYVMPMHALSQQQPMHPHAQVPHVAGALSPPHPAPAAAIGQAVAAISAVHPSKYGPPPYRPFEEGMEFIYQADLDANGILYYLGTQRWTKPWQNPGELGVVQVTSVPLAIQPKSEPATAIVGRSLCRCVTLPNRESWFVIDLLNIWVRPTAYTLRHYDSFDTEAMRDWKLQGSNDGKKWTKLISHKGDASLNAKGATKTWAIPKPKKAYRMLRILQTGRNSNGHWYCALSSFEIYGKIYSSKR